MYKPLMGAHGADVSGLSPGLVNPGSMQFPHPNPSSHSALPLPPANFLKSTCPPSAPHAASQTAVISPFRKSATSSSVCELATSSMTSVASAHPWQASLPPSRAASHIPVRTSQSNARPRSSFVDDLFKGLVLLQTFLARASFLSH